MITTVRDLDSAKASTGMSLLFAAGGRPSAEAVEALLREPAVQAAGAGISHRPGATGRLEILASGLTFDLSGLAPGAPEATPRARHFFGLPEKADSFQFEAVRLAGGEHVAAGAGMIPLVRIMMSLALAFAGLPGLRAVSWHPAGSWMDAGYFARITRAWLAGGAFPVLGLAAMVRGEGGEVESRGLRFFTGQELRVEGRKGEAPADTVKLAVRAADMLVRVGRLDQAQELTGPEGERLLAEPSPDGRMTHLRRIA